MELLHCCLSSSSSNIEVLMRIAGIACALLRRVVETVRDKSIRDVIGSIMLLVTNSLFARPDKWTN